MVPLSARIPQPASEGRPSECPAEVVDNGDASVVQFTRLTASKHLEGNVTIQPGSQLGSYTILGNLTPATSSAEEGEVWRSHDAQSNRDVSIRTLPAWVANDPERLAKIGTQAKALATLEHPHAARLYGLEESDQTIFIVTELVEGESLADRLRKGAIPVREGLALALQIAEALEAAHDAGILHRDLNPSNIHITADGGIKIINFGMPGLLGMEEVLSTSDPNLSNSPTMTVPATHSGSFSGTSAYLAPEQARGDTSDVRADIWGFGCVLFQILSGQAPFRGKTESDVRAAVLRTDPDWTKLPGEIHPRIRFLIERCLEKDARRRPSDMSGVRADIAKTLEDTTDATTSVLASGSFIPWAAAVVAAAILGLAASWALAPDDESQIVRFQMWTSQSAGGLVPTLQAVSPELAISPDGARIAFKGLDGGLYLRDRDDMVSRPVQITGESRSLYTPLFSRDGRELYYVDAPPPDGATGVFAAVLPRPLVLGQIPEPGLDFKKIPVDGGTPTPVLTGRRDEVLDPTWTGGGEILFVDSRGTIQSVSANGGTPTTLLEAPGARHPQLLPGGDWLLYSTGDLTATVAIGAPGSASQIVVQSLADPEDRRVVWEGGGGARYVEDTGHIVYQGMIQPGLWAFPFDAGRLERTGDPVPLVEGLIVDYAMAETGALAYAMVPGVDLSAIDSTASGNVLALVGRAGAVIRQLRVDPGVYRNPRVAPDGSRVAYEFVDASGESHIWIYDLEEDFPRKLTSGGENRNPIWKDDQSVTYASNRDGTWGMYTQPSDGSGSAESVISSPDGVVYRPQAWAPDGTLVLVIGTEADGGRAGRLALLPANGDGGNGEVSEIAPAEPGTNEFGASVSPDGAWLAYIAECPAALGCARVQRFPPVPGSSFLVSENESWVQFSPDGTELVTSRVNFYDTRDVVPRGASVDFENSRRNTFGGFQAALDHKSLDLRGPAGNEFVAVIPPGTSAQPVPDAISSRIGYIHNFFEVLRARVRPSANP